MMGCISVDLGMLWAGLRQSVLDTALIFLFVGGLVGIFGWKRPTRMAWLHNKLILGLIGLIAGPVSLALTLANISLAIEVREGCIEAGQWWLRVFDPNSEWNTWVIGFPVVGGLAVAVYFFKTMRPAFLVKKTGKGAVDEAVARYRKAGEEAYIGRPRLVVDGVGYYQVVYGQGEGEEVRGEPLLVREDGQVVRDEALARRIMRVADAAFELGEPEAIMERYELYRKIRKMENELDRTLRIRENSWLRSRYEDRLRERYPDMYGMYERMMGSVEVFEGYLERLRKDLERLAAWSWEKRGPKMGELREEEVEAMEEKLEAVRYWWADEERVGVLEAGKAAAERMKAALTAEEGEGARMRKEDGDLWWWLWDLAEPWVEVMAGYEAMVKKGGGMRRRWFEVTEEDVALWRRRLGWVREVEGRRRGRGVTG